MKKQLLVGAMLMGATAGQAQAVCTQANMAGTWKLYSAATRQNALGWVKCTMVIGSKGSFGTGSICSNNSGETTGVTGSVNLLDGANCTFAGSIRYTLPNISSNLTEATMAQSHETMGGVGSLVTGAFIFNMVKVK